MANQMSAPRWATALGTAAICMAAMLGVAASAGASGGPTVSGHLLRYSEVMRPGAAPSPALVAQGDDGRLGMQAGGETVVYDGTKTWECKSSTDCESKSVPGISYKLTATALLGSYLQPYGKNTVYYYFVHGYNPAPSEVVAGVPSMCKSAVSIIDHSTITVCVAKHGGFLTNYTSSTETIRLVSVRSQVPVSDLERP
jgi:hypothetical protein